MMRPNRRQLMLASLAAIGLPLAVRHAGAGPGTDGAVFAERGVAIRGTDPVAYFTQGRPQRGLSEFTHDWRGVTWRFASAANRDAFAAAPARYAPQYGGFCAWAVAQGYTAPIDPAAWKIVDARLYLNFDRAVQRRWEADIPGHVARADANWPAIAARLAPG